MVRRRSSVRDCAVVVDPFLRKAAAMDIVFVYTKKRKAFGRSVRHFTDVGPTIEAEILPDPELGRQYMEKNPCVLEMHCIVPISVHAVNTDVTTLQERGIHHQEGGWPRDIDHSETEGKIRFMCVPPAISAMIRSLAPRSCHVSLTGAGWAGLGVQQEDGEG